ncbi:MAG: lycopene cyclase [Algicola sp.]|nr:lycopene cyclase [Algicola sp.]
MSTRSHFDYIIIGNGLAGLQLALKLTSDTYFDNKRIALIDPSEKSENDKTWSFWETDPSPWDSIIHKTWNEASILTNKKHIDLNLKPYKYKTIRAIDFYEMAKSQLAKKTNVQFLIEKVISVSEGNPLKVTTEKHTYTATHVFDSRIPEIFHTGKTKSITLIQHFKGWVIQTSSPVFDDNKVVMMDFRLKENDKTNFMYVLPFSTTEALVEFTYFTEHLVEKSTYESYLKRYIREYLNIYDYTIKETESGQIPMTNFKFEVFNTPQITKIGTAGGWVKGSTGYSFKHTEKKVATIIENLKQHRIPSYGFFQRKYKFYDKVFLKVLKDNNHKGEWLFERFYGKNSVDTMFRFLDEESSLTEELKIMTSLWSWSFIKAFFKTL